jgi:hypothetical protein
MADDTNITDDMTLWEYMRYRLDKLNPTPIPADKIDMIEKALANAQEIPDKLEGLAISDTSIDEHQDVLEQRIEESPYFVDPSEGQGWKKWLQDHAGEYEFTFVPRDGTGKSYINLQPVSRKENTPMEKPTFRAPHAEEIINMLIDNGSPTNPNITLDNLVTAIDQHANDVRQDMIADAQTVNQEADAHTAELEAIEEKLMPEPAKERVRQMTNHEHIVAKRAGKMGITVEEYKARFPKGGPVDSRV